MDPQPEITTAWIDDGCIFCSRCVGACPEVFDLDDDGAVILDSVRSDGRTSPNRGERAPLNAVGIEHQEGIRAAADACPIAIIRFATG